MLPSGPGVEGQPYRAVGLPEESIVTPTAVYIFKRREDSGSSRQEIATVSKISQSTLLDWVFLLLKFL